MIAGWLDRHRRSVLLAFAVLALSGALSAWRMPVGLFPLVDFPRIVVSLEAGDRPVERMVVEVTRPLEQALRGVPELLTIHSSSSRGSAEVSLSFAWTTNMVTALMQAESVVSRALPSLPVGTTFTIRRMDPTVFPVLGLSLTSLDRPLTELHDLATYQLAPALSSLPGVAEIQVLGGRQSEYQILLDPLLLRAHDLTPDDVAQALGANNGVSAVGRLEDRYRLYLGLLDTHLHDAQDIRRIPLRATAAGVVELGDVGEVRLGEVPEWTRVNADGKDAVLINIMQQRGASTMALVRDVNARLNDFKARLPAEVQIASYYDQSELIVASASSVRDAILIGALLAAMVLWLALRNLRITLVVSLVLPLVLLATCVLLQQLGQGFNIMTLGGMAAAVGLVVDDAVVMIEHIARRIAERDPGAEPPTMLNYAAEMLRPLVGSSAATIVVFLPLTFLGGLAGGFFRPLALTMAATLTLSLLVALLVVPLLARLLLREGDFKALLAPGSLLQRAQRWISRAVNYSVAHAGVLMLPIVALLCVGGFAYGRLGSGFMPHMDEGGFIFDYWSAPGTSITETDRLVRQVEAIVRSLPEVASYSRRSGLQLGGGLTEANEGDMFIKLKPQPRRHIEAVMSDLRQRVGAQVPGLEVETAQLMEDLIGDLISNPQPIEIKLFGPDNDALRKLGVQVAAAIGKIPGVVEVFDGSLIAGDAIEIRVDRVAAAIEGLNPADISAQIELLLSGSVSSTLQIGEKMVGIRVWTPADLRSRMEQVGQFKLRAPDGHYLPLQRVASIGIVAGQAQQARDNLRPTVIVTARLEGRDLGSAMREVQSTVAALNLAPGYTAEYGGIYREQQQSFRELLLVFIGALLLVAVSLMFLYERTAIVVAILGTSLLTIPGVLFGLWITGSELDLSSMIGLTMVVGIVTEVAIFFFAEIDTRLPIGSPELSGAAAARLRPILMTTSIAMLALLPLALGLGEGAEMQRPLAITIVSGLIFAVPLVLLVMPGLFSLLDHVGSTSSASRHFQDTRPAL
ncbi:efflux RND transporter permease subunit [Dokdonella sp.]|uniref:efflux RND transporter permease subunit n=1 Tax=Dokdonella sp. TaxID=2291710 RepID=UPI00322066B8